MKRSGGPGRWPWEKDPTDREANYRRPVRVAERARLTVKAAAVVAAFFWIKAMTRDGLDVGAEFLIGVGTPVLVAGSIDLVWTIRGELEHIFVQERTAQLALHAATAMVGVGMIVAGVVTHG